MALEGDLSEFPLIDIIQLVDLSKKSGAVTIDGYRGSQRIQGKLYFRDGKIIGAEMPDVTPLEAVYTFFTLARGPFKFVESEQLATPMISISNEVIIMEGIMRQDAWASIQQQVPSLAIVPRLVPNPASGTTEINLEAEEWRVLTMVNGKNTVGQIAQRSGLGEFRTCEIIAQLLSSGLIEKRDTNAAEALASEFERITTSALGPNAAVLLQEACRQARVADISQATSEQLVTVIAHFEHVVTRLTNPSRARQIADELRRCVQDTLG